VNDLDVKKNEIVIFPKGETGKAIVLTPRSIKTTTEGKVIFETDQGTLEISPTKEITLKTQEQIVTDPKLPPEESIEQTQEVEAYINIGESTDTSEKFLNLDSFHNYLKDLEEQIVAHGTTVEEVTGDGEQPPEEEIGTTDVSLWYELVTEDSILDALKLVEEKEPEAVKTKEELSTEKGLKIDLSKVKFEYQEVKEPGKDEKPKGPANRAWDTGIVYSHDVWVIAKEEDVNYHLLLALMEDESAFGIPYYTNGKATPFKRFNVEDNGRAHGVTQMFPGATEEVYADLLNEYPELGELSYKKDYEDLDHYDDYLNKVNNGCVNRVIRKTSSKGTKTTCNKIYRIYNEEFVKTDRESVYIQVHAGAKYLKVVKSYLKSLGKPTDVKAILQGYHDGAGAVSDDGTSRYCISGDKYYKPEKCDEAQKYTIKIEKFYSGLYSTDGEVA